MAITLWIFHQPMACHLARWPKAESYGGSNLERLVDRSTHDGKGHTLKELATNVRRAGHVCVCAHTNMHMLILIDCILFVFPGCKFSSKLANRQYVGGNFITRITSAVWQKPNSIKEWPYFTLAKSKPVTTIQLHQPLLTRNSVDIWAKMLTCQILYL